MRATSVRDAERLRGYVFNVIVDLLSLGVDPERATLFVQSDVPETAELTWLLTSVTPMGWLEKCVSYKDKVQQGIPAEHGLFAYPVLQAADILLYDADVVPVGQDQKQHLEITRDIAERFNNVYGKGVRSFAFPSRLSSTRWPWSRASTGGRCRRAIRTRLKSSMSRPSSARSARRS